MTAYLNLFLAELDQHQKTIDAATTATRNGDPYDLTLLKDKVFTLCDKLEKSQDPAIKALLPKMKSTITKMDTLESEIRKQWTL